MRFLPIALPLPILITSHIYSIYLYQNTIAIYLYTCYTLIRAPRGAQTKDFIPSAQILKLKFL